MIARSAQLRRHGNSCDEACDVLRAGLDGAEAINSRFWLRTERKKCGLPEPTFDFTSSTFTDALYTSPYAITYTSGSVSSLDTPHRLITFLPRLNSTHLRYPTQIRLPCSPKRRDTRFSSQLA